MRAVGVGDAGLSLVVAKDDELARRMPHPVDASTADAFAPNERRPPVFVTHGGEVPAEMACGRAPPANSSRFCGHGAVAARPGFATRAAVTDERFEPTVAVELVAPALKAARHLGASDSAVWAASGIAAQGELTPGARLTVDEAHAIWSGAVLAAGDRGLGLVAASLSRQGDMDVLDYVLRGSPTLRAGYETVRRFWRLAHDCASLDFIVEGGKLLIEVQVDAGLDVPPSFTEWGVGSWARVTSEVFGPLRFDEVRFRHDAQVPLERYEAVFGCRPRFLAAKDALITSAAVLDHTNPAGDERLVEVLERYAEARLREIPERPTLSARVASLIREALPRGELDVASIARRLRMSERTLRRRLEAERTSHSDLLDGVRRELALRYLGEEGLSVEEASFRLGFNGSSGLNRAFKRWTGVSPSEYRSRFDAAG
jgi:AraC-like DNA-binding protein